MLRLREEPREEDLEVVVYWTKENGFAWPCNENNIPLRQDGTPFRIDEKGLLQPSTPAMDIDLQEREEVTDDDDMAVIQADMDQPIPSRLVFKLKLLSGRDDSEITQTMIKQKTTLMGGRGRRNRQAKVETETDLVESRSLKLEKAIVSWEGIGDENGNEVGVEAKYINMLPNWIFSSLIDKVDEMSQVDEEESGE